MNETLARLSYTIESNDIETATKRLRDMGRASQEADRRAEELTRSADRQQRSISSLNRSVQRLRAVMALAFSAVVFRGIEQAADEFQNLQSRVRLVTEGTEAFSRAWEDVVDVAQRTRSDLSATVALYTQLARSAGQLGLEQRQLVRITETIGQAMVISGASAESQRAALIQLQQGLAAGVLRGQEFNSVMEQTPRLAQAMADSLAVGSVGALRAMANEGELTAQAVTGALLEQSEVIAAEFTQMPRTIGQAFQQLQNDVLLVIGEAAQSARYIDSMTAAIDRLRAAITSPEFEAFAADVLTGIADGLAFLVENAEAVGVALTALGGAAVLGAISSLAGTISGLFALVLANPFTALAVVVAGAVAIMASDWETFSRYIEDTWDAIHAAGIFVAEGLEAAFTNIAGAIEHAFRDMAAEVILVFRDLMDFMASVSEATGGLFLSNFEGASAGYQALADRVRGSAGTSTVTGRSYDEIYGQIAGRTALRRQLEDLPDTLGTIYDRVNSELVPLLERAQSAIDSVMTPSGGSAGTPPPAAAGGGSAGRAAEASSALAEYLALLEREQRALELTERQNFILDASVRAAAAAQRDYNDGLRATADLRNDELDTVARLAGRTFDAGQAQRTLSRLIEQTRTPLEAYRQQLAELEALRPFADTPEEIAAIERALAGLEAPLSSAAQALEDIGQTAFQDLTRGFARAIVMGDSFSDTLRNVSLRLADMALEAALFGGGGGVGDGLLGGAFTWIGKGLTTLFGFADGGIMTRYGPLPLQRYNLGGIANSPQLALYGEGSRPEAIVPLPDGRSIPVSLSGGASGGGLAIQIDAPMEININANDADSGADIGEQVGMEVRRQLNELVDDRIRRSREPGGQMNQRMTL